MERYSARFSKSYTLWVEQNVPGNWEIRIDGPIPIIKHIQQMSDLGRAQQIAYWLARWHFEQQRVDALSCKVDELVWLPSPP